MEDQLWLAVAAQIPLVVGLLIALQRGYLYIGRSVDQDRLDRVDDMSYREQLRLEAIADRKAADGRVEALAQAIRESNELMARSVALNERIIEDFVRPESARTRATDKYSERSKGGSNA